MSFFMWILLIVAILGFLYYIGDTYGNVGADKKKKDKETFSDPDSDDDEPKSAKKKKAKESYSESEDEEEPKPHKKKKAKESFSESEDEDKKKKKKKVKDICFGDFCLPKDRIQEEIEDMDDDTKDELIKMLRKQ